MDRTIIVGYDATPRSHDALALASLLARTNGAALAVADRDVPALRTLDEVLRAVAACGGGGAPR